MKKKHKHFLALLANLGNYPRVTEGAMIYKLGVVSNDLYATEGSNYCYYERDEEVVNW